MLMKGRQLIRLSVAVPVVCNPVWLSLGLEKQPTRVGAVREQIWDARGWVVAALLLLLLFLASRRGGGRRGRRERGEERGGEIKQTTKQPNNPNNPAAQSGRCPKEPLPLFGRILPKGLL